MKKMIMGMAVAATLISGAAAADPECREEWSDGMISGSVFMPYAHLVPPPLFPWANFHVPQERSIYRGWTKNLDYWSLVGLGLGDTEKWDEHVKTVHSEMYGNADLLTLHVLHNDVKKLQENIQKKDWDLIQGYMLDMAGEIGVAYFLYLNDMIEAYDRLDDKWREDPDALHAMNQIRELERMFKDLLELDLPHDCPSTMCDSLNDYGMTLDEVKFESCALQEGQTIRLPDGAKTPPTTPERGK